MYILLRRGNLACGYFLRYHFLESPVSHHFYGTTKERIRQEVVSQIGKATEQLIENTRNFFSTSSGHYLPLLSHGVELIIQNSPDEVTLQLYGAKNYVRALMVLRWTLRLWYGLWNRDLRIIVNPMSQPLRGVALKEGRDEALGLDIKWRIEGIPRGNAADGRPKVLLSGYSHYYFEDATGKVCKHVMDRLVPPTARGSLLWRYLERLRWPVSDIPKPIVPSDQTCNRL